MVYFHIFIAGTTCPTLTNPSNGNVVQSGNTDGSTADYSCNQGYALQGNVRRICVNGQWTGDNPTCVGMLVTMKAIFQNQMSWKLIVHYKNKHSTSLMQIILV